MVESTYLSWLSKKLFTIVKLRGFMPKDHFNLMVFLCFYSYVFPCFPMMFFTCFLLGLFNVFPCVCHVFAHVIQCFPMFSSVFPYFPPFSSVVPRFPYVFFHVKSHGFSPPAPGCTRTGSTRRSWAASSRTTWRPAPRSPAWPSWTPWGIRSPRRVAWMKLMKLIWMIW